MNSAYSQSSSGKLVLTEKHMKLIEIALLEIKKNKIDTSGYKMVVFQLGNISFVSLRDANYKFNPNLKGSPPAPYKPTFHVRIDNKGNVITSGFSR